MISLDLAALDHSDWIAIVGTFVGSILSIVLFKLQQRLSDKQKIDNRLHVEREIGKKLYEIHYNNHSGKIQLYNTRLLNKQRFKTNSRSFVWGFPYHSAELYGADFDGIEYVIGIEEWGGIKYYKIGVIDYESILGVRPEGDGSFNGIIFYVKPKLIQKNKYSIAYKHFRYYPTKDSNGIVKKPLKYILRDSLKKLFLVARYNLWYRWKTEAKKK